MSHDPTRGHLHQSCLKGKTPMTDQTMTFPIQNTREVSSWCSGVGGGRSAALAKSKVFSGQRRGPILGVVAKLGGESLCSSVTWLRDEAGQLQPGRV